MLMLLVLLGPKKQQQELSIMVICPRVVPAPRQRRNQSSRWNCPGVLHSIVTTTRILVIAMVPPLLLLLSDWVLALHSVAVAVRRGLGFPPHVLLHEEEEQE